MTNTNDSEHRCSQRTLVNRTVGINSFRKPELNTSHAKLLDLSFCGMRLISNQAYEVLTLTFS